ncbi:MAG: hypothetical protein LBQ40_07015, partial [Clostridiales bacterium]|nr:hypothetical protein [Clostridiales bacterium]
MAGSSFRYDLTGMSPLLRAFFSCYNDWKDALAPLTEDEADEWDIILQNAMRSKQEILLKQMSDVEIQYIIDNYAGIAQAKI